MVELDPHVAAAHVLVVATVTAAGYLRERMLCGAALGKSF